MALLVLIIVVGFFLAVTYHYVMGHYLGKPWPANTFLYVPEDRFFDFSLVVSQSAGLDPFGEDIGGFAGSPLGQSAGYLFSLIRPSGLRLAVFFGCFFAVFIPMVKHYLFGLKTRLHPHRWIALFALVFLTYPILFALDRANFDLLVLPLLLLFVFTYTRGQHQLSTVFLGLAIALKPFTAVFIMVYVFDRRYRHTLLVFLIALFVSMLSLALFKDGLIVESRKYLEGLSRMGNDPSFGSNLACTSDLFSMATVMAKSVGSALNLGTVNLPDHPNLRLAYALLSAALVIYLLIHLWQKPRPLWKTVAVLTILIIVLPFNTHDYRLIYLFVPLLMYLASEEAERHEPAMVFLWGLLLVPKNYLRLDTWQSIAMIINPLLLIALLICLVPDAFTASGAALAFGSAWRRVRTLVPVRKLANPRSS